MTGSCNTALVSFQNNTDLVGIKYIHAYLREHGKDSRIILQTHPDASSDDALVRYLADSGVRLVGISVMSHEFVRASKFVKTLKSRLSDVLVLFGGIHSTVAPEECCAVGDGSVVGEGEHAMLDIIRCMEEGKDWKGVDNVCYMEGGELRRNPVRPVEEDLDIFPFPQHLPPEMYVVHGKSVKPMDRELFRAYSRYNGLFMSLTTTRGCPFACTYCCNSVYKRLYKKRFVRERSVENVIRECVQDIAMFPEMAYINVQDDCFMMHKDEWLEEFADRFQREVGVPFIVRTTPLHFRKGVVSKLKAAGLEWISVGLQSGSEEVNKLVYKRNVPVQRFIDVTKEIREMNLPAYYDIILDNPYEKPEDVEKTLDAVLQVPKPFLLQLYSLRFFQGTELHHRAVKEGVDFTDPKMKHLRHLQNSKMNRLIRMAPALPGPFVKLLSRHSNGPVTGLIIDACHWLNVALLEPLIYLRLMFKSKGYNIPRTAKILGLFMKTFVSERVLNRWGFYNR